MTNENQELNRLEILINGTENIEINEEIVTQIAQQFNAIFENDLINSDTNYFNLLSNFIKSSLINFINESHFQEKSKGLIWIIISLLDNTFLSSVTELYKTDYIQNYKKCSVITSNKNKLLELTQQIYLKLNLNNDIIINDYYEKYKTYLKNNNESDSNNEEKDNNAYNDNLNDINYKSTLKPVKTITSISSFNTIEENEYRKSPTKSNSFFNQKQRYIASDSVLSEINIIEEEDGDVEKQDILSMMRKNTDSFIVNHCKTKKKFSNDMIIDNFYTFDNKSDSKEKIRRVISTSSKINFSSRLSGLIFKKNSVNILINENKGKESIFQPNEKQQFLPYDKDYQVEKKDIYTKNDKELIYHKNKIINKKTNSLLFYLNNYYQKTPYIKFRTKVYNKEAISLQHQNYQCYFCKKRFKLIFEFPIEIVYWCSYYAKYMCFDCASTKYTIIPDFILESWCFKKFSVSKKAYNLIEKWYKKPIICIKGTDKILRKSEELILAVKYSKQIHLIYDLMKCIDMNIIIEKILGDHKYLVLKEILFSLEDLFRINNLEFLDELKDYVNKLEDHLKNCQKCEYKGIQCVYCKQILDLYDVENVKYCRKCDDVIHKTCKECIPYHDCVYEYY